MENNSKIKLLTWCIVLLVLVNIAALALVWFKPDGGPMKRPPGPPKGKDPFVEKLSRELGWTEGQMKQFEDLKRTKFSNADELRDSIYLVKKDLVNAVYALPVDSVRITELTKRLGNLQYNIEHIMFLHFTDILNICTPEQREKCKEIIKEGILRGNAHSGNHEDRDGVPPPPPPGK